MSRSMVNALAAVRAEKEEAGHSRPAVPTSNEAAEEEDDPYIESLRKNRHKLEFLQKNFGAQLRQEVLGHENAAIPQKRGESSSSGVEEKSGETTGETATSEKKKTFTDAEEDANINKFLTASRMPQTISKIYDTGVDAERRAYAALAKKRAFPDCAERPVSWLKSQIASHMSAEKQKTFPAVDTIYTHAVAKILFAAGAEADYDRERVLLRKAGFALHKRGGMRAMQVHFWLFKNLEDLLEHCCKGSSSSSEPWTPFTADERAAALAYCDGIECCWSGIGDWKVGI